MQWQQNRTRAVANNSDFVGQIYIIYRCAAYHSQSTARNEQQGGLKK